jgi:hypothetical protein
MPDLYAHGQLGPDRLLRNRLTTEAEVPESFSGSSPDERLMPKTATARYGRLGFPVPSIIVRLRNMSSKNVVA